MIAKRHVATMLLGVTFTAQAYELATHAVVTRTAYNRSVIQTGAVLQDLGIDPTNANPFGESYFDVFGNQVVQRSMNVFEEEIIDTFNNKQLRSVPAWLMRGAIREDDNPRVNNESNTPGDLDPFAIPPGSYVRVVNHFYDPVNDRALTVTPILPWLYGVNKAPDWAIGTTNIFTRPNNANQNRGNHFTWFDAREAMYRALGFFEHSRMTMFGVARIGI